MRILVVILGGVVCAGVAWGQVVSPGTSTAEKNQAKFGDEGNMQRGFVHPGVLVSKAQLDFVKKAVAEKRDPMFISYQQAVASQWGRLDYKMAGPPAKGTIVCGPYDKPNVGCSKAHDDAMAAYVQSLLWYISGDQLYANNAIKILNAYAQGLKQYTGSNAPVEAAWDAELWPRAAEILRYSNAGWKSEDIAVFSKMLKEVVLPKIEPGSTANGDWELSMVDAMMNIAIFTDDRTLFYYAEAMWKERVPSFIYVEELDGAHPKPVPRGAPYTHWFGTTDLDKNEDGMTQETCRDLRDTSLGLAAMIDAAETAHIQGDELYESEQKRLVDAMEFDSHLLLKKEAVPAMVCGGKLNYAKTDTFVIGYNEFHNRLGVEMPETRQWLELHVENDPTPEKMLMIVFEPLTHGADGGKIDSKQ
jgi:hypothetical protein